MSTHKPGCEALGGYGHGVGKCSCGAEMSDTPRTDANGVVATIYRDGYWSHKMPEQDPFPYLSQHGPIDVCLASELTAERERADRNQEDAERYRWLKDGVWDDRLTRIIELRMNAIWDAAIDAARRK